MKGVRPFSVYLQTRGKESIIVEFRKLIEIDIHNFRDVGTQTKMTANIRRFRWNVEFK